MLLIFTLTVVMPEQRSKAELPMLVNELGIVMDLILEHL